MYYKICILNSYSTGTKLALCPIVELEFVIAYGEFLKFGPSPLEVGVNKNLIEFYFVAYSPFVLAQMNPPGT